MSHMVHQQCEPGGVASVNVMMGGGYCECEPGCVAIVNVSLGVWLV